MERQRVHFVYRTTNLVNGKFYIGVHTAWSVEDDYLGSGNRLKRAIRKYGKENFQRVILWVFDVRDEAYRMEVDEVGKCLGDPLCMNIHPGGNGGFIEARKRLKWLFENDPEWNRKRNATMSSVMKMLGAVSWLKTCDWRGRAHRLETKQKIGRANSIKQAGSGNSQYGKQWMTNGSEEKKVRVDEVSALAVIGWRRGRSSRLRKMVSEKLKSRGM